MKYIFSLNRLKIISFLKDTKKLKQILQIIFSLQPNYFMRYQSKNNQLIQRNLRKDMKYLQGKEKVPETGTIHYLPYLMVFIGNIFWPLSWVHNNQHNISFAQSSMVRGFTVLTSTFIYGWYRGIDITYKSPSNMRALCKRNIIQSVHGLIMGFCQFILPLPIIHTIGCSGTLFVFLIDYLQNGITINRKQAYGIAAGLAGVLLATNGSMIMKYFDSSYQESTQFQNYLTTNIIYRTICGVVFLLFMFFWAYGVVLTKQVKNTNTFQINFHLGTCLLILGAVLYPFANNQISPYRIAMSVIFFGLPLVIAQWFFIAGLSMCKNHGVLTMINFTTIAYTELLSYFRYDQTVNIVVMVGIVLVFVGVYQTIFNKSS